jgi:formylglycine-generating enzyme required for sulfatase activity
VVKVSWKEVTKFCEWLSRVSGKKWRLPKNEEWEVAVGKTKYPWGDYFPPKKEDGNYAILADGKDDPAKVGVDGVKGTALAGSFRANALGFFDLGGNAEEWMLDGYDEKDSEANRLVRGGSWNSAGGSAVVNRGSSHPLDSSRSSFGFRVALSSAP